jgi:hypothetical protein
VWGNSQVSGLGLQAARSTPGGVFFALQIENFYDVSRPTKRALIQINNHLKGDYPSPKRINSQVCTCRLIRSVLNAINA